MQVFDFTEYREYLFLSLGGSRRTGRRQKLAHYIGCQPAHLSQIFKFKNNLSLEHAHKTNIFLGHNDLESDYFLNMVLIGNAGSVELKNYYLDKNQEIKKKAMEVGKNIKSKNKALSPKEQAQYYSNELYSLVHVAVSLPFIQTIEDLSQFLNYNISDIQQAVIFLRDVQILALESDGTLTTGPGHTFLGNDSPFLKGHHHHVRRIAEKKISQGLRSENLHYATYYTLSKKDYQKIHKAFLKLIDENVKTILPSEEEIMCCNIIDFFRVI